MSAAASKEGQGREKRVMLTRRDFLAAGAAGAAAAFAPRLAGATARPNVLLVLVDQWRQPHWFPAGAELPGFERLCREGVSFSNHFVSAVPCSPSRACLFTGFHLTQHGIQNNVNRDFNPSLDPRIPTLGHLFQEAGYRTPYFGKWHLTLPRDRRGVGLTRYGFEGWHGPDHHGAPLDGALHDGLFVRDACDWLQRHGQEQPWFLTCSLINPHDICYYHRFELVPSLRVPRLADKLPDNFSDDLASKPRIQAIYREGYGKLMGTKPDAPERVWLRYLDYYYYFCRLADRELMRLLATLDQLRLTDNTIVIFTADHGEMGGSHQLQAKGPFVYQENNNVPLVFRWPGQIQAGAECPALSHNVDIFPTLVELTGIGTPSSHLPGRSLASLVREPAGPAVHEYVLMGFGMTGGGRIPHLAQRLLGLEVAGAPIQIRALYDGRWKFARYFDEGAEEEYELYDLQEDPLELWNLAADAGYRSIREEMAERLAEAEAKEMAPLPAEVLYRKE